MYFIMLPPTSTLKISTLVPPLHWMARGILVMLARESHTCEVVVTYVCRWHFVI